MTEHEKIKQDEIDTLRTKLQEKERLIVQLQELVSMQGKKKFENMPHRIAEQ